MKIVIPKETFENERRVPMIPVDIEKLIKQTESQINKIEKSRNEVDAIKLKVYMDRFNVLQLNLHSNQRSQAGYSYPSEEVSAAVLPAESVNTNSKVIIVITIIMGLLIGIFCVGVIEFFK